MSFRQLIAVLAMLVGHSAVAQAPAEPAAPAPAATTAAGTPTAEAATAVKAPEAAAGGTNAAAAAGAGDPAAGQGKIAVCSACHGMDGNPASAQYPKLAGQHESYIARQLTLFKEHKRDNPIMMGFAAPLSAADMNDIGAYFATKNALPGVADTKFVSRGEALYRGGDAKNGVPACMACHGPDGRGNPGAGYPQLAGQFADYVTLKLNDWRNGKTWGNDERSKIMPVVAKGLSDADVAAVASYIEGLHAAGLGSATAATK